MRKKKKRPLPTVGAGRDVSEQGPEEPAQRGLPPSPPLGPEVSLVGQGASDDVAALQAHLTMLAQTLTPGFLLYQGLVCIVLFGPPTLKKRVVKTFIALKKRALYKRAPDIL